MNFAVSTAHQYIIVTFIVYSKLDYCNSLYTLVKSQTSRL